MEKKQNQRFSLLSNRAIKRHLKEGNIIIEPFDEKNLGTCSYDVTLGEWYYREQHHQWGIGTYSPYSEDDVRRVWGKPQKAEPAEKWMKENNIPLIKGVKPEDLIIWISPGETILCHTKEFIGGCGGIVTSMMKARSSLGRNFIEVCKCAGWGDVGFTNRWTMEITNNSRYYQIPLVVGRRIAQVVFFEVEEIEDPSRDYLEKGKYQSTPDVEELKRSWTPEMMLPKMWKDYEVAEGEKK
jgi:dCTP deaminase